MNSNITSTAIGDSEKAKPTLLERAEAIGCRLAASYLIFLEVTSPFVSLTQHPVVKSGLDLLANKTKLDPKQMEAAIDFLGICRTKLGEGAATFLERAELGTATIARTVNGPQEYQMEVLDRVLRKNNVDQTPFGRIVGMARDLDIKKPLDAVEKLINMRTEKAVGTDTAEVGEVQI